MDDGLIQMLVVGLFIAISIMEGVTRKKRRQGQMTEHPTEAEVDFLQSLTGREPGEPEEAEGLVPDEIGEEIADLAGGKRAPTPDPVPDPEGVAMTPFEPDSLVKPDWAEEREDAREAVASTTFHRLHSSHVADRETDSRYRKTSEASAMLRLFGPRGARGGEIRRAIILSKIPGPTVSMREPREP